MNDSPSFQSGQVQRGKCIQKSSSTAHHQTRESEEFGGYSWQLKLLSISSLLTEKAFRFKQKEDNKLVAKLYSSIVAHRVGIGHHLYLKLCLEKTSREIQYYYDFDGA